MNTVDISLRNTNGQSNPRNVEDGLDDGLRMALMTGEKENTKE